jgi:hypothetical protein
LGKLCKDRPARRLPNAGRHLGFIAGAGTGPAARAAAQSCSRVPRPTEGSGAGAHSHELQLAAALSGPACTANPERALMSCCSQQGAMNQRLHLCSSAGLAPINPAKGRSRATSAPLTQPTCLNDSEHAASGARLAGVVAWERLAAREPQGCELAGVGVVRGSHGGKMGICMNGRGRNPAANVSPQSQPVSWASTPAPGSAPLTRAAAPPLELRRRAGHLPLWPFVPVGRLLACGVIPNPGCQAEHVVP